MNNYNVYLEESLFENRNKAYGAYAIRTAYASNMTKGMMLSIGLLVSFFISIAYFSKIDESVVEEIMKEIYLAPEVNHEVAKIIIPETPKLNRTISPASAPLLQKAIAHTAVNVVPNDVAAIDYLPPTNDELENAVISNTNSSGNDTGNGNAAGTNGPKANGVVIAVSEPAPPKPPFYTYVAKMPSFPDGEAALYKFLSKNLHYPTIARDNGIEGTVTLQFVINEVGKIEKIVVVRGIGGGCDQEAIRVVKSMPDWKPGIHQDKPVPVRLTLPIKFSLKN